MNSGNPFMLLDQLLAQLPMMLVSFCGLGLAIAHWSKARTPALLVLIGSIVLLSIALLHPLVMTVLFSASDLRENPRLFGNVMQVISWFTRLALSGGILLVMLAVFLGRGDGKSGVHPPVYQ